MPGPSLWLTRGFANDLMLRPVDVYDRFLEAMPMPYSTVISDQNKQAGPGGGPNPYGAVVTLLMPALAASREPAAEGWVVDSVGGNLVDDGGKLDGKTDIGAGPARPGHVIAY